MPFFVGEKMTGGYGGPDIISSCTVNVNRGEIVAILGPNGAGKSTAMKAMLGLLNLKSGKVIIDGKDISKLTPQDRVKEGIVFTTFHFPEHMVNMVTGHGKDEETMCAEYKVSSVEVQKISNKFKTEVVAEKDQAQVV